MSSTATAARLWEGRQLAAILGRMLPGLGHRPVSPAYLGQGVVTAPAAGWGTAWAGTPQLEREVEGAVGAQAVERAIEEQPQNTPKAWPGEEGDVGWRCPATSRQSQGSWRNPAGSGSPQASGIITFLIKSFQNI